MTSRHATDSNNLIGRPGQYDPASFFAVRRLWSSRKSNCNALDTQCGSKIKSWPSAADATARAKDIQTKLKTFGLGAEYDYVRGTLILRLAGDLNPTRAKAYEAAFTH